MTPSFWLRASGWHHLLKSRKNLNGKAASSNLHTTLRFPWAIQLIKRSGRRFGRNMKLEKVIVAMWKNETAWRGTRKEERTLENKSGPRRRPTSNQRWRKRSPQDNEKKGSWTKGCKFRGGYRKRNRKRVKSFKSHWTSIYKKKLILSIGFNNKDVICNLSESGFRAAKHISQLPWVEKWMEGKQRCFSWPALPLHCPF